MKTNFRELFDYQQRLMCALGVPRGEPNVFDPTFVSAVIGLSVEASEVLDEVNVLTRPWANKKNVEVYKNVATESIDVFFYLLEVWNLLGLDEQMVTELYKKKLIMNMRRVLIRSKNIDKINLQIKHGVVAHAGDSMGREGDGLDKKIVEYMLHAFENADHPSIRSGKGYFDPDTMAIVTLIQLGDITKENAENYLANLVADK